MCLFLATFQDNRSGNFSLALDERGEVTAAQGMAELAERLDLDLTDPFPRHGKPLADFLERVLAAVPRAEPQPEDFFLAGAERPQRALDLSRQVLARQGVARGFHQLVLDELPQLRVLADRRLERQGLA